MHRKYIIFYIIFLLILGIPVVHNISYLYAKSEFIKAEEVIERQMDNNYCLYASGLFDSIVEQKLKAYELKKPDVIAIGSSRALQFREGFFSHSFYNMGLTMSSIAEADAVLRKILPKHKPKLVLMNVDFWWFHEKYREPGKKAEITVARKELGMKHVTLPTKWALDKKITWDDYLLSAYEKNKQCGIGVKGSVRNAGYAGDGSYYYTDVVTGKIYNDKSGIKADYKFENIRKRVEHGKLLFFHGTKVNAEHIAEFMDIVKYLQDQQVEVVFFISPLAPHTLKLKEAYDYAYIEDMLDNLKKKGVVIHDYRKLEGTSDCEFIDGFHGGDVAYARLLSELATKDSRVAQMVDEEYLRSILKNHGGLAMIPNNNVTTLKEQDFLGVGCKK